METWKQVVGFEGRYEVSDLGRVRSVDRLTEHGHFRRGVLLQVYGSRYAQVNLGKDNPQRVHRLVLRAFVGECPVGCETLHDDDDKMNCKLANLRYGTRFENMADRRRVA